MTYIALTRHDALSGRRPIAARLASTVRKLQALAVRRHTETRMQADLARLAETAPHLLPDIGLPAPERSAEAPPRHLPGRGV